MSESVSVLSAEQNAAYRVWFEKVDDRIASIIDSHERLRGDLAKLLGAVECYIGAGGQVKGEAFREMQETVLWLRKSVPVDDLLGWPGAYECLQTALLGERKANALLNAGMGSLSDNYTEAKLKLRNLESALSEQAAEIHRLRADNQTHRDKAGDEYWVWQGDDSDVLESLVCPILIRPGQLRAQIDRAGRLYFCLLSALGHMQLLRSMKNPLSGESVLNPDDLEYLKADIAAIEKELKNGPD